MRRGGRCGQTEAGISAGGVSPGISLPQRECRVSARSGGGGLPFLEGPLTKTRWARRNRQRNQSNFLLGQNTRQDCPHLGWRRYKHAAGIRRGVVEGGWGEGEATAEVEKPSLKCAQGAESRAAATSPGAQWARGPPPARARRPAGLWLPSSPKQRPGGGRAELRRGRPRGKWGAGRGAGAAARDCGSERRTPRRQSAATARGRRQGRRRSRAERLSRLAGGSAVGGESSSPGARPIALPSELAPSVPWTGRLYWGPDPQSPSWRRQRSGLSKLACVLGSTQDTLFPGSCQELPCDFYFKTRNALSASPVSAT